MPHDVVTTLLIVSILQMPMHKFGNGWASKHSLESRYNRKILEYFYWKFFPLDVLVPWGVACKALVYVCKCTSKEVTSFQHAWIVL